MSEENDNTNNDVEQSYYIDGKRGKGFNGWTLVDGNDVGEGEEI